MSVPTNIANSRVCVFLAALGALILIHGAALPECRAQGPGQGQAQAEPAPEDARAGGGFHIWRANGRLHASSPRRGVARGSADGGAVDVLLILAGAVLALSGGYLGGFVWADLGPEERAREPAFGASMVPLIAPNCTKESSNVFYGSRDYSTPNRM